MAARAILHNGTKLLNTIYQEDGGGTGTIVAIEGGIAPSADPAKWKTFSDPVLAPDGTIAFLAKIADKTAKPTEDEGLWTNVLTGPGSAVVRVLQEGHEVGIGAGVTLKKITSISARDGEIIALVTLAGNGVTGKNNTALLRLTTTPVIFTPAVQPLIRTGDVPAPLGGAKMLGISALQPALFLFGSGPDSCRWSDRRAVKDRRKRRRACRDCHRRFVPDHPFQHRGG